jgi:hypothetical protein
VRAPRTADLRAAAQVFNGFANVDAAWVELRAATDPAVDLSKAEHRALLLRWLNAWGCRIRYPRAGEPAPFDPGVAAWWAEWAPALPEAAAQLEDLADERIDAVADAYAALSVIEVSAAPVRRTLGPTAAAKALYALRPQAVMPWDAAIAVQLHGSRDGAAFGRHLRLGREWARAVIAESGLSAQELAGEVGRPAVPLAKVLDEYLYVTVTLSGRAVRARGE